jgi:PAS domain S-box-containing protein
MPDMTGIVKPFNSSISTKIIILLVVCLSSVITLTAIVSYFLQRQELYSERDKHSINAVERLAFTMSAPLWNFDLEQLGHLALAEMKGEGSVCVLIRIPDGRLLMKKTSNAHDSNRWVDINDSIARGKHPAGIHTVSNEIRRGNQVLGTVQIVYEDKQIDKALSYLLFEQLIKAIILLIISSIVVYLGLLNSFLKRLNTVYIAAREFGRGNLSGRLKSDLNDEIGVLSETFNQMADRISDKICQLETAFDEVKQLQGVLDDIINSLPSIIVVLDSKNEVVLWNNQAEIFTGISSGKAAGSRVDILLPEFGECLHQTVNVLNQQQPCIFDKHSVTINGQKFRYSVQLFPLVSEKNRQVVLKIDDITEHERLEEMMVQTEKMTMVGGLAAGMAHEINNPLAAIMQNAQNIQRRISAELPVNKEAASEVGINLDAITAYLKKRGITEFVTHIMEAGSRIAKIVNTLLRFTNIGEMQREIISLPKIMEQTLELAASDYEMKKQYNFQNIVILREYDPLVPPVFVTVSELEHVLLNLLKNAAQAASSVKEQRPPQIILRTKKENHMSVIEIEDNGKGMNEIIQRRVFEPFYSTRDVGEGTGLGLSISYAIITNTYNGQIEVQSRSGEGTCFIISIPSQGSEH